MKKKIGSLLTNKEEQMDSVQRGFKVWLNINKNGAKPTGLKTAQGSVFDSALSWYMSHKTR